MVDFIPFPKISRLSRECVITEKLDGTNAQVLIGVVDQVNGVDVVPPAAVITVEQDGHEYYVLAGSRARWIRPGKETDNFGFAGWVVDHAEELVKLGPGTHFGEWWGLGIQRGYGLTERRWSLFNTGRWNESTPPPACCHVVPVIHEGPFDTQKVEDAMTLLRAHGSRARPGFMDPEGVIIFHAHSRTLFKKTFKHDAAGKPE